MFRNNDIIKNGCNKNLLILILGKVIKFQIDLIKNKKIVEKR